MRYYKVNIHTKTYASEFLFISVFQNSYEFMFHYYKIILFRRVTDADLVINRKDFPDIQLNDIVEIYHPEDDFSRLLLQVTVFKDDLPGKGPPSYLHRYRSPC